MRSSNSEPTASEIAEEYSDSDADIAGAISLDSAEDVGQEALQEVAEQTAYGEIFLADLISRQVTLSLAVAATFLATIFSIPLFNYFLPSIATIRVLGFTLSWLLLGVLVYPLIWGLAFYYVSTSKGYEDDFTQLVR